jgi:uncharacterized protein involved in outer membrane biogenesis
LRSLIVIAVLLVALIAGLLVAVPRLLVWEDYRAELTARAEAMTGRNVAIRGRIDLNLLPQPTLSLAQTTLWSRPDAEDRMRLEVDRLDLELKPLPLLGGRLDVEEVRLVRPVLRIEPAAAGRAELPQLVGAVAWLPLRADGPSRITVVDGRAILSALMLGGVGEIDHVNLELSAGGPSGAVVLDGTFALNSQPLQVSARLGRPTEDASSTLRLALTAGAEDEPAATTLTFGGVVWWRSEAPRLRGELALAGKDARSAIGRLGAALGYRIVPMPASLAAPFRVAGPVELADHRLRLPDFVVELDGADLHGRLSLALAAQPELDLALDAAQLTFPVAAAVDGAGGLTPLLGLAAVVRGRIDLSIGALEYRGEAIRRLRASLRLTGDGAVAIADARAILPGQTDVSFTGDLAGIGEELELRGRLAAVTGNLRAALAWLDVSLDHVAEGRLSSLSLASRVSIARDVWRFGELELRVDASRATGSVVVAPAPRPQVAAKLALDRFDLDAYWPGEDPAAVLARLAQPLSTFDAAIEAQLARLTWGGAQLLEVGLAGRAVDGHLRVEKLTVGDLAEAEVRVAGEVDLQDGAFDLSAELRHVQAARVLRRLGFEPPPLLARLEPLAAEGRARGSLDAAQVELELRDGSGKVALAGEIGLRGRRPHYRLAVEAEHPDYQGLLGDLGARAPAAPAAPLAIAGRLEHDGAGKSLIAGTARLGATSFTGRVAWQDQQARPRLMARFSVGEPTPPVLAGLLDLSGLRLEWPSIDGAVKGRWSERPLALDLLDRFDGELTLSSKGGLAGPGFELTARFEEGTLALDHVAMALWGGRLEGQLSLDVRRPLPYLTASLDLKDADLGDLAAWLGVAPVVAGPADLRLEATGAGSSVRALVGSLIGEVEIAVHEGAVLEALPRGLLGAPAPSTAAPDETAADLADLAGTLPLQRGVVILPPTEIQIDGADVRLEGQIDLYLWATDLTLRPDAAGPALRVVGPLDRPQVRLSRPPPPGAQAPGGAVPGPVD